MLGACALAALLVWLFRGSPAAAPASPPPPPFPGPRATSAPAPDPTSPALAPLPGKKAPPQKAAAAPIIDEITVEKPEVCEGEENLVSVRAHTPDGTDEFLHYTVGGRPGQRVPVRSWTADDGDAPPLEVKVFGRDNVATVAKVPPFVVKQCKPARAALVTAHLRANTWSDFDLEVHIVENAAGDAGSGASTFRPKSYEWSFGDGQTAVTQIPYTTHNFEGRRQDTMFSNFLVEVKVRGNSEEPVVGRTTLQLLNPAFEDLAYKGVVSLMVQLAPRFPELGSDGVVRQKVRLWHNRDRPVFIHSVAAYRHTSDPMAPVAPVAVDPSGLMGASVILPGHGLEFEARLDTNVAPDVFSVEYQLEGKDSEGLPARGSFSIMRPPPRPTRENSTPVEDPLLKAKIVTARRILNQEFVTDEDLWRLEREGKFAELEAQFQGSQGGPQRPPVDPRDAQKDPGPPPAGPTDPHGAEGNRPEGAAQRSQHR